MKNITLVIMAAGIGSRYGGGIKQLAKVGPSGELIIDYSIYDALEAGFNKIVFVIRKDLEKDFKEIIGNRIEKICKVEYAYQELEDLPDGFVKPEDRTKPWGTGQAILSCKDLINEPFAIINADDYYGKEAYRKMYEYLTGEADKTKKFDICMAGFILKNTLSDNGSVTRGICVEDENGYLTQINETKNIVKTSTGAEALDKDGTRVILDLESRVSMNMWGVRPGFIEFLEEDFKEFLKKNINNTSSEYLLPIIIDDMIKRDLTKVKVLPTTEKWLGMTYKEDRDIVAQAFVEFVKNGIYKEKLF